MLKFLERCSLSILLIFAFSVLAVSQTSPDGIAPPTKEEKRLAEKKRKEEEKEFKRLLKESDRQNKAGWKEKLKRPAEIQINAPSDKVGAHIVQALTRANYQISEEGKYRMVFTQEVTGFRGSLAQSLSGSTNPPLRTLAFTVSQIGEVTTVSVDASVLLRKPFGRVDRVDMNKKDDWRRDIENLLAIIKLMSEAQ